MLELIVYNNEGKEMEKVSVDEAIFGGMVNKKLLQDLVVMYEGNQRRGTASTKDRSEVEGSTKKPWKQKHTGRARVGSIRSPIWRHGGVVFGPNPRDFYRRIPQQLKLKALDSALLSKLRDKETVVIDALAPEKPKTKNMCATLKNVGITTEENKAKNQCLVSIGKPDRTLFLSMRNIPGVKLMMVADLNAYDVLKYRRLLLTKEALDYLISVRKPK